MYKTIPGNRLYKIALNGEIKKTNDFLPDLCIVEDKVSIVLNDRSVCVDVKWLELLAHFECSNISDFMNVYFVDYPDNGGIKTISKKLMRFRKPVYFNNTHRIIPGFTRYAVSKAGNIVDVVENREIKIQNTGKGSYPNVFIYDPDISDYRYVMVHRLVAFAWVNNRDFIEKPIVNHINGDKDDFHYRNLEWVSYSRNVNHAQETGLKNDCVGYKVRDISTDEVKEYISFRALCLDLGLNDTIKFKDTQHKCKPRLIKGRYQVKRIDDPSPWEEAIPGERTNRYTINVTMPNGEKITYKSNVEMIYALKLWGISFNIKDIVEKAKVKYPGIEIEVIENITTLPVQAYRIDTGEILEADSLRAMARLVGIGYSTISVALKLGETHICKGYAFRFKTDKPWDTNFEYSAKGHKPVKAVNLSDNSILTFSSFAKAGKHFKVSNRKIKYHLENEMPLKGYAISRDSAAIN